LKNNSYASSFFTVQSFLKCLLLLTLLTLTPGCYGSGDKAALRKEKSQTAQTINIGVVWPFASDYKSFINGIVMASDEINLSGGVLGKKISLRLKDDESNVSRGMIIADQLAADPEVCAAIGFCNSYVTLPVSYIYEAAGILMVTTASTAPGFNPVRSPLLFRTVANGSDIAKKIADVINRLGYKKAVLCYVKNDYGLTAANACEDELKNLLISVIDRRPYISGSVAEFNQITDCWKLLKFDCVILFGDDVGGPEFIKAIRKEKIAVPVFCGDAMNSPELINIAGGDAEGAIVSSFFNPSAVSAKGSKFVTDYKNRFGVLPDSFATGAYDTLKLVAEAIKRAQNTNPQKIAEALRSLKNEEGVANSYSFDERGEVINKKVFLKIVSGKKFIYLDSSNEVEYIKKSLEK